MTPEPVVTSIAEVVTATSHGLLSDSIIEKLVTWILVILGWVVVSAGHNRRERRKEVRATVLECIRDVREIEAKAHDYRLNTSASDGKPLELQLKARLKGLGNAVDRLRTHDGIDVAAALTVLRQAVTGNDFESAARVACAADSVIPHVISEAAHSLIDALESRFRERYP